MKAKLALLLALAALQSGLSLRAQVNHTLLSLTNVNYSGYIIDADADTTAPGTIRDTLLAQSMVRSVNTSPLPLIRSYEARFRLLDFNDKPFPIYASANGTVTNTDYTLRLTNTVTLAGGTSTTRTDVASLRPAARLNPHVQYTLELRLFTNNISNRQTNREISRTYYHFTNRVSGDSAFNVIPVLNGGSFSSVSIINTVTNRRSFPVSVTSTYHRYDDFQNPSNPNLNIPFTLTYELRNAATEAVIPIKLNRTNLTRSSTGYLGGSPPAPRVVSGTHTLQVEPADGVQLDSVSNLYKVVVTMSLTNDPVTSMVTTGNTAATPDTRLLHFNGKLIFGTSSIETRFTSLANNPPILSVSSTTVSSELAVNNNSGFVVGKPTHTYGDGTALPVVLLSNGDGHYSDVFGAVALNAPASETDVILGIRFERTGGLALVFGGGGAVANLTVTLPTGFGYGTSTNSRRLMCELDIPDAPLGAGLAPSGDLVFNPGSTVYACEETKGLWFPTASITWKVGAGQFEFFPNAPPIYVRGFELNQLEAAPTPAEMKFKRSNEQHQRWINGYSTSAGKITVRHDAGHALMSANLTVGSGGFPMHFPYGAAVGWSGEGRLNIVDDLAEPATSFLGVVNSFGVSYARDCPEDCPGDIGPETIQFAPETNGLRFTVDGGLAGQGTITTAAPLHWGYIATPEVPPNTYAQTVSNVTAAGFHMSGCFLRGDQTTVGMDVRPAVVLLTGVATDFASRERSETPAYADGFADYAGLNFRASGATAQGLSTLAGVSTRFYDLASRSKYYTRWGGVSGIHQAVPADCPDQLTLYDYRINFDTYSLSYLDSLNDESRTEGSIEVPDPVVLPPPGFVQEFEELTFTCLGGLEEARVPEDSGEQRLKYWNGEITPLHIEFRTTATCSPLEAWLVMFVDAYAAHLTNISGALGFKPDGNFITAADVSSGEVDLPDFNSRLRLPTRVAFGGPAGERYSLSPMTGFYYNNPDHPLRPPVGFISLAGTLDVPFFQDMKVHFHTSAKSKAQQGATDAPIDLMGGWTAGGRTYFTHPGTFDADNEGFPNVDLAAYQNNPDPDLYHPRAEQNWLDVVPFDYPLRWTFATRSFKSAVPDQDNFFVVNIQHQVKHLSAQNAELAFGAQYDALPRLNLANLAFNAVAENIGVLQAFEAAGLDATRGAITNGLGKFNDLLTDDPGRVFGGAFDRLVQPVVTRLYNDLKADYVDDPAGFPGRVEVLLNNRFSEAVGGAGTIEGQLKGILDDAAGAQGLINQVIADLQTVENAIDRGAGTDDLVNLLDTVANNDVVRLAQQLINQLAPEFGSDVAAIEAQLQALLTQVQPSLAQLNATLADLKSTIEGIRGRLSGLGGLSDFAEELDAAVDDVEIGSLTDTARDAVLTFFNRVPYDVDNPFTAYTTNEIKRVVRQAVEDQFFGSAMAANIQQVFRQRLYDADASVREAVDSVFQQINDLIRDVISQTLAEVDRSLNKVLGSAIDSVMAAGSIDGYAHINGDALRELRLDGHFQLKTPENLELNAYLRIRELDSDGADGCPAVRGETATEVTLGATDVNLDWISPNLRANVGTKFTFDPGLVGLAGTFEINGDLDFEVFRCTYFGAALAFGRTENYLSAGAEISFNNYSAFGGLFFGKTCTVDPIALWDPEVARLIGEPPFTGAYGYVEVWIPISEVLLGIPASCVFRIDAGVGAGAGYFVEGPTFIGKMFAGVSGEALCLVHIHGEVTMIGVKRGDDFRFSGNGRVRGKAGSCPFCVKFSKTLNLTYENDSWDVDY